MTAQGPAVIFGFRFQYESAYVSEQSKINRLNMEGLFRPVLGVKPWVSGLAFSCHSRPAMLALDQELCHSRDNEFPCDDHERFGRFPNRRFVK
jgi:hypothetical protein